MTTGQELPIQVAALYRFTAVADCAALKARLERACADFHLHGTLLVAPEGINGTIAGTPASVEAVLDLIRSLPGCADLSAKLSRAAEMPFHRMKVRVKREIVTMGEPDIDPLAGAGHYVAPADWNDFVSAPGTILIDTRNDYEVAIGSFAGAIDPKTKSFRDFPAWFRAKRAALLDGGNGQGSEGAAPPRVAMFCTGGIRCEKATAFLKAEGVDAVYHLEGGILKYLETVPAAESLWQGECFVFDERVAVGHGLAPGTHRLCRACRRPVSEADRASALYQEGVRCPACHDERDDAQRARYAERHFQTGLAERRGVKHVGAAWRGGGEDGPSSDD
ncbi:oxygen-dependent tRNA uridine(34) hydroxylase TrhO [Sphingosinicella rhizophila]|uniref:tRNA uridine(34) hydroxylase n=1 Tax=Sphingosinicella rhizophila TaxID=3050082 RepID=A0ABU3QB26_9SPHN|nr:rhodanese-related sulfurtransferase [Sphingosinicella sp. GR2756]MDT9600482.1 rhodanese-related sulfurtransferase [Sphingosinicella sp. GR2756]